ncbi:hypothetical protein EDD17DRAFT_1549927 [Pisolithus thermaeus]|nr:hypothetical protein EDD17DRAFT_1549927 [Pisolithus thermaeus]
MRLSFLPVLVAGAGMIASQVVAEPIRLVVEASEANPNIRFGHVLANANVNGNDDSHVARVRPTFVMATSTEVKSGGPARPLCNSIREKAIRLSNTFRHALGLPIIETGDHHASVVSTVIGKPHHHEEVHVTLPIVDTPEAFVHGHHAQVEDLTDQPLEGPVERPHHPHKEHGYKHKKSRKFRCHKRIKGFFKRIHKALTTLGPWEGRAIAFVLGCGIGVLLRLFWVLSVLLYRTVRGEREEQVHEYIVLDQDLENVFIAPPQYIDEKHEFVEDEKLPVDA